MFPPKAIRPIALEGNIFLPRPVRMTALPDSFGRGGGEGGAVSSIFDFEFCISFVGGLVRGG